MDPLYGVGACLLQACFRCSTATNRAAGALEKQTTNCFPDLPPLHPLAHYHQGTGPYLSEAGKWSIGIRQLGYSYDGGVQPGGCGFLRR